MQNVIDDETVKNVIQDGLAQVDDTLSIDTFACAYDSETRKLSVDFTAKNGAGDKINIQDVWG